MTTALVPKRGTVKYALSASDGSIAAVEPGRAFKVECAINLNDGTIRHVGQQLTPGDMLTVEVLGTKVDGLGFSSL